MKRSVKLALWCVGALFVLGIAFPPIISATPAEPKYLCAQCHIMDPQYHSYLGSEHAAQVTCSSCHVPHDNVVTSLTAKYSDGLGHIVAQMKGAKAEDVRISSHGLDTVLANCASCHKDVEHVTRPDSKYCITCHADEPHGEHTTKTAEKGK